MQKSLMPKLPTPVERTPSTGLTREERQGVWPSSYVWNGYQYVWQQPVYSYQSGYGYPQQTYGYQSNYGYQSWQRPQQNTWQQQTWQQPQQNTWQQQTWQQPQQNTWQQQTHYGGQSTNVYGRRYSPKPKLERPLKQEDAVARAQYASDLSVGDMGRQGDNPKGKNCYTRNHICRPTGRTFPLTPAQLSQMYQRSCDWSKRYVYEAQDGVCQTNCDCDGLRVCWTDQDGATSGTCRGQAE